VGNQRWERWDYRTECVCERDNNRNGAVGAREPQNPECYSDPISCGQVTLLTKYQVPTGDPD